MAIYKVPVFERGCILTQEMMERLKAYAVGLPNLEYKDYSDGIVSGCEIVVQDHLLEVQPGIFRFQQKLFFITEGMKVPYGALNEWQAVKISVVPGKTEKGFLLYEVDVHVTSNLENEDSSLEIGRFRLQNGAMLRYNYRNFGDLATEYDTLNLIHAKWSAYKRDSISGTLLSYFAKEAMERGVQETEDFMMIEQILQSNGRTLNRSSLELYISKRLARPYKELTNEEIYKGLGDILKVFEKSKPAGRLSRMREDRRIIVD